MSKANNYGGNPYGQGTNSFPARQVKLHPVPVTGVKHKSSQVPGFLAALNCRGCGLGFFIPAGAA